MGYHQPKGKTSHAGSHDAKLNAIDREHAARNKGADKSMMNGGATGQSAKGEMKGLKRVSGGSID